MGPKGTRASLPATSGPLITSAAQCQHLAGGHAPGGRLGPGAKAAGTPSGCGLHPTLPCAPPPLSQLPGRRHQSSALGAHDVARAPPALTRATTRARPTSSGGRTHSAPWAAGAPSPALALPAPPARGETPPRRAGALLGRAPGDRRCARPPPQELGDMLVNWFHYPPPSASCVHGSNLNWSLHLSRRIATLYTSVSPRFSREGHSPPGPRGPAGCGCGSIAF